MQRISVAGVRVRGRVTVRETRHNFESIETILRQLEAQGQDFNNQRVLVRQITKLEEGKAPANAWTVESLRKSMRHYDLIHENGKKHFTNFTKRPLAKIPNSGEQSAAGRKPYDLRWKHLQFPQRIENSHLSRLQAM